MAKSAFTIRVEGVPELKAAFKIADLQYRKEIQTRMRELAGVVADHAKEIADSNGLKKSGALIGGIKPGVQGAIAVVRDSVKKGGFNYPAVYEGELSGHGLKGRGPRPFLGPAVTKSEPEVIAGLEEVLDKVAADFN
jgi:hypothetical protein